MDNQQPTEKKTKRKLNYHRVVPIALGILILIILIIGVVRLIIWNQGQEYIIDESVDVESEPEDLIFFMDPSIYTDNNDDGKLTILALGNDTLAYDKGGINIAEQIAEQTGATVYNCALEGSYMAALQPTVTNIEENPLDAFSFFWISDSIQTGNWDLQYKALPLLPDNIDKKSYTETIDFMKTIDYASVDLLIIYYDGHDYLNRNPIANPTNIYDVTTMEGSFTGCFERYPINYPNMQAMLISPTFCYVTTEDGKLEGCDLADLGHGNLPTCMTTLQTQAQNYGVSYVDNFYGIKINAETADKYLLNDGITPNDEGRIMIAERISGFINARIIKE